MNPNIEGRPGAEQTTAPEPAASSAGGGPIRFYQGSDWLSFGVTAGVSLAVYLLTLAPEVTLRFSGLFATGANYAGVPDVPGFPVWTVYAWLFARLLPFSNIAWRVAVSSAVAGAAACGLLALMVSRGGALVLEGTGGLKRLRNPRHERWLRGVCAVAAGMGLALDRAVWSQAVIVETWTFALLLLAGMLSLLLRWSYEPQKLRYFYGAVALYALNLSNHQGMVEAALGLALLVLLIDRPLGRDLFASLTLLFFALLAIQVINLRPKNFWALFGISPIWQVCALFGGLTLVVSIVLALRTRGLFNRWAAILGCWVVLGLGLTPYFYLPITSMTNPPMNWGYPRTVEGFVHLVSRRENPGVSLVTDASRYAQQVLWYAKTTWQNLGWMYLVAAVVPFFFLRRMQQRERAWFLGLIGLHVCLSLFQIAMLNPAPDLAYWDWVRVFFSPAEFMQALFAGYGLLFIGTLFAAGRGLQAE